MKKAWSTVCQDVKQTDNSFSDWVFASVLELEMGIALLTDWDNVNCFDAVLLCVYTTTNFIEIIPN